MFGPLESQCTYRCVVLPDILVVLAALVTPWGLNAPTGAWCSLTPRPRRGRLRHQSLNAPTGAWCSLTVIKLERLANDLASQCTYRCVVLPDGRPGGRLTRAESVSMHLQVRGAP